MGEEAKGLEGRGREGESGGGLGRGRPNGVSSQVKARVKGQEWGVGGDRCDPGQEVQGPHGGLLLSRKGAGSLEEEARMDRKLSGFGSRGPRGSQAGTRGQLSALPAWQEGQCSHGDLHSNGPEFPPSVL